MDDNYEIVGKSVEKKDSLAKVMGNSLFSSDIELDGMLYGGVKRSEKSSAYIKNINLEKAKKLNGVQCILTYQDIPGINRIGIVLKDEPVLVEDKIRRYGDAIALVAADSKEILEEALELIEIEYEELKGIYTIEDALKDDSPKIHGTTNIIQEKNLLKGDVEKGFSQSDIIVENIYRTNLVSHMFIEPESGIAKYENGELIFWSSTQNPHFDRGEVSNVLNIKQNKIRSIQAVTGGGFGGKLDISVQCHIALLAYYTQRPIKMTRTREESTIVSSKRHPIEIKIKTGAKNNGKLMAVQAEILGDTGAYASYGPAVIGRVITHLTGPYEIENVKINAKFVYTNNPMAGAFRGFGVPQAALAHEGQLDIIAKKLKIDPYEIRIINALKVGSLTSTNQELLDSVGIEETIRRCREKAMEIIKK